MGSACSARVEVCPSSKAVREGVPCNTGSRSASGRRPWNPTLAQKTRKNGPPGLVVYPAPVYLIHPVPGPPSDTPATRSVWKVLFLQVFTPQVSSDMSVMLPSTVLYFTVLGEPTVVMKIPVCEPLTVLPRTRFPGDSISIPLKLLLSALFATRLLVPLNMSTPPSRPSGMPLRL